MTGPGVTTYVRYLLPGVFFPGEEVREVASRDPQKAAREAPEGAFAFTFHDQMSTVADGVTMRSHALNVSGRYYIDAEPLTACQVGELPGDHSILLSNMRSNGWDTMLRCRTGNFQPLEPGDEVISSGHGRDGS